MLLCLGTARANAGPGLLAPDASVRLQQRRFEDAGCYKGDLDGIPSQALDLAARACPRQDPILRIENGTHLAAVGAIGVDARCKIAATGSDDKTIRIWSMPDGVLLRTLRGPIGDGDSGKVFAVAVSPDGRRIAAGGWDAHYDVDRTDGVYLFEIDGGDAMRRTGAFDDVIRRLVFSPDGQRLAIGLGGQGGVRVLDFATGRELMADRNFAGATFGLAFGPGGALYAVSDDGYLRRYDSSMKLTGKVRTIGGRNPNSVAADSTGTRLAVGYDDTRAVDLFDARDLKEIGAADSADVDNGNLAVVAWSADGEYLYAGGRYSTSVDGVTRFPIRRFSTAGKKSGDDVPVAGSAILSMAPCGDATAFSAGDPAFGLLTHAGVAVPLGGSHALNADGKTGDAFMVSADGTRLQIGLGPGSRNAALFDLSAATLSEASGGKTVAPATVVGLDLRDWRDSTTPNLAGRPIALEQGEFSRAVAIRRDRSGFALGGDFSLLAFDGSGKPIWARPVAAPVAGINIAGASKVLVVVHRDGVIRWRRWKDGDELLALFIDPSNRRWVAWTPRGYYMASPGGDDLIGWQFNRGWRRQADFFPASLFRERFNRPDIVRAIIQTLDEGQAVERANIAAKRREDNTPLAAQLPPIVSILAPAAGAHFDSTEVKVDYAQRSPSGAPIDRIVALVDGREAARGAKRESGDATKLSLVVPAPDHDFELGLVAYSGKLAGAMERIRLAYAGKRAEEAAGVPPQPKEPASVQRFLASVTPEPARAPGLTSVHDCAPFQQKGGHGDETSDRIFWDATPVVCLHALPEPRPKIGP